MNIHFSFNQLRFSFDADFISHIWKKIQFHLIPILTFLLCVLSIVCFYYYLSNGLGLAYNDSRSHLDIGRRVVEGLKPGLAQLGSVWLPLPHILMVPTIWNDFMWHTGLSGSIQSMISFVITGLVIYKILEKLGVGTLGKLTGVGIFVTNINVLYLQSTAMTELLLLATMTLGAYELMLWYKDEKITHFIRSAFWIMLSTLIRYDGWFLCAFASVLVLIKGYKIARLKGAEGLFFLFATLAGFGIFLWLVWNAAIFSDPLYFAFGPYSAHAQQEQLDQAGVLITKKNIFQSITTYWYALAYNSNTFFVILAAAGMILLFTDKKLSRDIKLSLTALLAPLFFNILALYLGHSVLFIQGINGNTWFNVRYGIMMMPSIAVFIGYLIQKLRPSLRLVCLGLIFFVSFFAFTNNDAVTIDDATVGSSQKNVTQVSGWLKDHVSNQSGFVLISAASHDAIIFSSGLPMKRFIHEGTGTYWINATTEPDQWARWIIMRTNDENDQTFKLVKKSGQLYKYTLMESYPFADIYQLKDEFVPYVKTQPVLPKQR